jgi:hypothetical protein
MDTNVGTGRAGRPMREVRGYHGEHRRHARDAHTPADNPATRPHDAPKQAAHDSLKLKMLDPAARVAEQLRYRKVVDESYKPNHAAEQLRPQEAKPEQAPPETRDKPARRIASRDLPEHKQETRKRKPERSWLPSNETSQVVVSLDALFTVINASYHVVPGKVDAIGAAALGVVVAGVAWANKRWKDRHGNRPEG